jgi:hypothetical protein
MFSSGELTCIVAVNGHSIIQGSILQPFTGYDMHYRIQINRPKHAYGYISSDQTARTAVVFIHGYCGDPVDTWGKFPLLIDDPRYVRWWRHADLYFYAYDTPVHQLSVYVEDLHNFLRSVYPEAPIHIFNLLPDHLVAGIYDSIVSNPINLDNELPVPFVKRSYSKLILVGHSLGGLVIRMLVRDSVAEHHRSCRTLTSSNIPRPPELTSAELRLFAPALFGTRFSGLSGWLLDRPFGELLARVFARQDHQLYKDVQVDSKQVEEVRHDTEEFWELYPTLSALSAWSAWSRDETVLRISKYRHDPPNLIITGKNHLSICKPTRSYYDPLEFVSNARAQSSETFS